MLVIVSETVATFHVQKDVWLTRSWRDAEPLPHSCRWWEQQVQVFLYCQCLSIHLVLCMLMVIFNVSPCILIGVSCYCLATTCVKNSKKNDTSQVACRHQGNEHLVLVKAKKPLRSSHATSSSSHVRGCSTGPAPPSPFLSLCTSPSPRRRPCQRARTRPRERLRPTPFQAMAT